MDAHLEEPFISSSMIGAQNPKFIEKPSIKTFKQIADDKIDSIISITLAPEVDRAKELILYLKDKGIRISLEHTTANYEKL